MPVHVKSNLIPNVNVRELFTESHAIKEVTERIFVAFSI
jgi:hypothetical protein